MISEEPNATPSSELSPTRAPELSSSFLRSLLRDLHTLSAAVHHLLEAAPLASVAGPEISVDQLRVLRYVAFNPDLRVGEVADRLGVKPPSASAALNRLHAKDLLIRKNGREDHRVVEVRATSHGETVVRETQQAAETKLVDALEQLKEEDVQKLQELIRSFVQALMHDEPIFPELCYHCGPGYHKSCTINGLFTNCPYVPDGDRERDGG